MRKMHILQFCNLACNNIIFNHSVDDDDNLSYKTRVYDTFLKFSEVCEEFQQALTNFLNFRLFFFLLNLFISKDQRSLTLNIRAYAFNI